MEHPSSTLGRGIERRPIGAMTPNPSSNHGGNQTMQMRTIRSAAYKVVTDYADYDEEYEYHQRLVADDTFGEIAAIKQQALVLVKYDIEHDVPKNDALAAELDALLGRAQSALDERAAQLREADPVDENDPEVEATDG